MRHSTVGARRRGALTTGWWCAVGLVLMACPDAPVDDGPEVIPELTYEQLLDPVVCAECHPEQYREWSGSMHAYASTDPVFLAMNRKGQEETDGALGDFCVGCHAPMAVETGATTDGLNLDTLPDSLQGVTCYFCHSVEAVTGTHNNPLELATDLIMRGGIEDPLPNTGHLAAYSPMHDRDRIESADLCGPCHDIVTPVGVPLERTFAEWQASLFSSEGPEGLTCSACHMPGRTGIAADYPGVGVRRVHDHSMPGVDTALTDFPEREAQRALVQAELDTTLEVELCVLESDEGVRVDVILENVAAGHSWPSGAAQDRRAWVELVAYLDDAVIYSSGVVSDDQPLVDLEDPDLVRFGDRIYGADGEEVHMFWEAHSVESDLLPAIVTFDVLDPDYVDPHVIRSYQMPGTPDRVTVRVRLRAMALDLLDGLIEEGYLAQEIRQEIETITLGASVLEWTTGDEACVP